MKLLNLLVVSILLSLLAIPSVVAQRPCKEIKATAEATNTTNGNDGSLKVTVEGNARNFRLFLIASKKEDNRLDLPVEEIKNLAAGNYEIVITESKEGEYCPRHLKVAIK